MDEHAENASYSSNNWAHQALLLMDEVDSLVRWAAVSMPDAGHYKQSAKAFWQVANMLADERQRIELEIRGESERASRTFVRN